MKYATCKKSLYRNKKENMNCIKKKHQRKMTSKMNVMKKTHHRNKKEIFK
jgi:hypothetical protein